MVSLLFAGHPGCITQCGTITASYIAAIRPNNKLLESCHSIIGEDSVYARYHKVSFMCRRPIQSTTGNSQLNYTALA